MPERVAGSDLIYDLCERSAEKGHRVFLIGGAEGVAEEAERRLCLRYPGLNVVGTESPPFRPLTLDEDDSLRHRLRSARPDILIVAFDQPRGEHWISNTFRGSACPSARTSARRSISSRGGSAGRRSGSSGSAWNGPSAPGWNPPGWPPAMPATRGSSSPRF